MPDDSTGCETETDLEASKQRAAVRKRYGTIASKGSSCCAGSDDGCGLTAEQSLDRGYSEEQLEAVTSGANLGLGCGNPTAIASLEDGATVLDLGSGAGFDCLLAAQEVGDAGRVIGVDMTPEMVERARENVEQSEACNVEFRLGEIEYLPVPDASIDVIVSNCVINLSTDKPQVFREAYRVLRPGGRLAISDVVLTAALPFELRADPESVAACVGGASSIRDLESMLSDAGFTEIEIEPESDSESFIREWDDKRDPSDYVVSASIEAEKPAR